MFTDQLIGIAGIIMLVIGIVYAISMIITAMKGVATDKPSMQLFKIIIIVFVLMFFLDYFAGKYESSMVAMWVLTKRLGLVASFGIVLMAFSSISIVIAKFISKKSDTNSIRRFFSYGLILSAIAFIFRWLLTGYI